MTVAHREVVTLWHYGEAAAMLKDLGAPPASPPVHVFLLSEHQGDGCPVMYRVLAVDPSGAATLTEPFGNCEEPDWSSTHGAGDGLAWRFAANADPALARPRPALEVRYSPSQRRLTETAVRPP